MSLEKFVSFAAKSFTLPDVCVRIRTVLDDPRSSAEDIAELISIDPSLTAKVLRLANSSLFRFPSQINSVPKAVNVIGGEALYNLVIAETASSAFKTFESEFIKIDAHWHASVYHGMVAKSIAKRLNIRGAERFFVMGILQNLSELVVAKKASKRYEKYCTFSHCSGMILKNWNLPVGLFYPVTYMHEEARYKTDTDICVLALASRITASQHDKERYDGIELFTPEMANTLSFDMEIIGNSIEYAEQETAKIVALIN
jgi:HD-like signal output (HDOD) protein